MCVNLGGLFINLHRADIPQGGKHSSCIAPVYVVVHVTQLNRYSLCLYNLLAQPSKGATLNQSSGSLYTSPLSPGMRGTSLRPIKLSTVTSHVPFSPAGVASRKWRVICTSNRLTQAHWHRPWMALFRWWGCVVCKSTRENSDSVFLSRFVEGNRERWATVGSETITVFNSLFQNIPS